MRNQIATANKLRGNERKFLYKAPQICEIKLQQRTNYGGVSGNFYTKHLKYAKSNCNSEQITAERAEIFIQSTSNMRNQIATANKLRRDGRKFFYKAPQICEIKLQQRTNYGGTSV
jgi:hypothetical protein